MGFEDQAGLNPATIGETLPPLRRYTLFDVVAQQPIFTADQLVAEIIRSMPDDARCTVTEDDWLIGDFFAIWIGDNKIRADTSCNDKRRLASYVRVNVKSSAGKTMPVIWKTYGPTPWRTSSGQIIPIGADGGFFGSEPMWLRQFKKIFPPVADVPQPSSYYRTTRLTFPRRYTRKPMACLRKIRVHSWRTTKKR